MTVLLIRPFACQIHSKNTCSLSISVQGHICGKNYFFRHLNCISLSLNYVLFSEMKDAKSILKALESARLLQKLSKKASMFSYCSITVILQYLTEKQAVLVLSDLWLICLLINSFFFFLLLAIKVLLLRKILHSYGI